MPVFERPNTVPTVQQIAAKKALLDAWASNFSSRNSLKQQIAAQKQSNILQAKNLVDGIAAVAPHEANWKVVQAARFDRALGISPSETELNLLRAIAGQCPTMGGSTPIAAIYMLPEHEIATLLPEDEQAGLLGSCGARPAARNSMTGQSNQAIRILSNPAKDRIIVELPEAYSGVWEVSDALGRRVLWGEIVTAHSFTVETGLLSEGAYWLSIAGQQGKKYAQKFFIAK